ncbi:hypothetical protein FRB94_013235 [Tulasnella sp. JGI-2019a]|nr:hypothetical protein FRB93_010135 [Tulasnella sp. JGI-2019a]KAG8990642.1 hypothetical protein FRB94_013235 [Tulasnella sp. JGI-2019a]KAG9023352.1 hypothetical protein FRB95_013205 [Tulasnella sp. JGI-2019a]
MSAARMVTLERSALDRDSHPAPETIQLCGTSSQLMKLAWKIQSTVPFLLVATPQIRWAMSSCSVANIFGPESKEPAIENLAKFPSSFHIFVAEEFGSPSSSRYFYYGTMAVIEDSLPDLDEEEYVEFDAQVCTLTKGVVGLLLIQELSNV